jgi:hypothetical protein
VRCGRAARCARADARGRPCTQVEALQSKIAADASRIKELTEQQQLLEQKKFEVPTTRCAQRSAARVGLCNGLRNSRSGTVCALRSLTARCTRFAPSR